MNGHRVGFLLLVLAVLFLGLVDPFSGAFLVAVTVLVFWAVFALLAEAPASGGGAPSA